MQSIFKQRPPRKFFCDFKDCGKSFTRAEHLQRHELNHRDSQNTCARCSAHFARPDLLERHMERHAQKDKEAGGEGLGILVTRKRCWRDENGNITAKRPASSMAAVGKALKAQRQKRGDSSEDNGSSDPRSPVYPGSSMLSRGREASATHEEKEVVDNAEFRGFQYEHQLEMQDRSLQGGNFILSPVVQQQSALYLGPSQPEITTTGVETLSPYQEDYKSLYNAPGLDIGFSGGYHHWLQYGGEMEAPGDTQENIEMALNRDMSTGHISTPLPLGPGYMETPVLLTPNDQYLSFPTQPPQPPQPPQQQQPFIKTEFPPENIHLKPFIYFPNGPSIPMPQGVSGYTDDSNPVLRKHRRSAQAAENCHPHQQRHVRTPPTQYSLIPPNNSGSHCIQTTRAPEGPAHHGTHTHPQRSAKTHENGSSSP